MDDHPEGVARGGDGLRAKHAPGLHASQAPAGDVGPVGHLRRRLEHADTDQDVRDVRDRARDELRAIRHGRAADLKPAPAETPEQRARRIVEHGDGLTAREAAQQFRVPLREVTLARARAGRDVEWGHVPRDQVQAEEQARRLRAAGLSIGAVAAQLRRPKSTVQRWLDRAA